MKHNLLSRLWALALALAFCLSLPAFAEPDDPAAPANYSLGLDKTRMEITLGSGDQSLTATVSPTPDEDTEVEWNWGCNRPDILMVTPDADDQSKAALRGVTAGEAQVTVTAQVGGTGGQRLQQQCTVRVSYPAAQSITLNPSSELILEINGVDRSVEASLNPDWADPNAVSWSLSQADTFGDGKRDIIKLSDTVGTRISLTAQSPGQVNLTAASGSVTSAPLLVTVPGVVLSEEEITIRVDEDYQLTYKAYGSIGEVALWDSGSESVAMVSQTGVVTGRSPGSTRVTVTVNGYAASCVINVIENTANTIDATVAAGGQLNFSTLLSQLEACCQEVLSQPLDRVTSLSVAPAQGTLYYRYVSADNHGFGVGSSETYYLQNAYGRRLLTDVCFVPNPTFTGTASIRYSGFSTGGGFFTGAIRVKTEGMADVTYSTQQGAPVTFQGADFSAFCQSRTGSGLSYVTFTLPDSTKGTLYYNYAVSGIYAEKVGTGRYYAVGTPGISQVTFLPADGFAGKVLIPYRGVSSAGTAVAGTVTVTVENPGSAIKGDLQYQTRQPNPIAFTAQEFDSLCQDRTGGKLDYVRFALPESSQGSLVYDLTGDNLPVTAAGRYYRTGTPGVGKVSFVPASGFNGDVLLDVTGYSVNGKTFSAVVQISVAGEAGVGEIPYTAHNGQPVKLDAADFNEACLTANGQPLYFVKFTLPDESQGRLYLNYSEKTGRGTAANKNTKYSRTGSNSISNLTFVPDGYVGQVRIPFTGEDIAGNPFVGTVLIQAESGGEISYSAYSGRARAFSADDFQRICRSATGKDLSYVRFELPDAKTGTLYHRYQAGQTGNTRVSANNSYYRTGGNLSLDQVSFVSDGSFVGTAVIRYTGWDVDGGRFSGTVQVTVTPPQVQTIRYAGDVMPVRFYISDFREVCEDYQGTALKSVQFTSLPSASQGRLWHNYQSPLQPGTAVTVQRSFDDGVNSLSQVVFVPAAGYQGRITLGYTATDMSGGQFAGTVEIGVSPSAALNSFTDLYNYSWAAPSVSFLSQYEIVQGSGNGRYNPGQSISRADFTLMLCRAFGFEMTGTSSFPDVPAGSYYAKAVAAAQKLGVVQGSNGRFNPGANLSRQDAMVMIQRAMTAAGRSLPSGGSLWGYSDSGQVAGYAQSAVASLVQAGVIQGNGGKLSPQSAISRAEMAVILHRVLVR